MSLRDVDLEDEQLTAIGRQLCGLSGEIARLLELWHDAPQVHVVTRNDLPHVEPLKRPKPAAARSVENSGPGAPVAAPQAGDKETAEIFVAFEDLLHSRVPAGLFSAARDAFWYALDRNLDFARRAHDEASHNANTLPVSATESLRDA